jgi:pimeloyl-ACP methyl ester carboxylesterase
MARFTTFDGIELAYEDESDGTPVVLLHGFAADTNLNFVRSGLLDRLVDEGYRVIAPDARGHGLSDKPRDPAAYAGDAMRRDVVALLDHLGLESCFVAGYSMGARTSLRVAVSDTRPRAVALLGAGENVLGASEGIDRRLGIAEAFGADDVESLPARLRAFRTMADAIRCDIPALQAMLATPPAAVATDLGAVAVPVAVICGEADEEVGDAQLLVDRFPAAVLVTVPGDHFTAIRGPELHEALADFLARHSP